MESPDADIQVDDETYPDAPVSLIESAVRSVLLDQDRMDVSVSVAFLPDDEMRRLNGQFLKRDRTTDVLAFALGGEGERTLGDIYVGYEQASRQADDARVPVVEELVRLVVHGTLHVLGHDHPEGSDRSESPMFRLQEELVRQVMEGAIEGR